METSQSIDELAEKRGMLGPVDVALEEFYAHLQVRGPRLRQARQEEN